MGTIVLGLLGAILVNLVSGEIQTKLSGWAHWLVLRAARNLAPPFSERFSEEWTAHLGSIRGDCSQFVFAVGCLLASARINGLGAASFRSLLVLIFAQVSMAIFGVPMLTIALMVRLDSRGPALYWANRIGLNGRPFQCPIFRTLGLYEEEYGITRVGRFLRRTGLDKLPLLYSAMIGRMSFIGPPALLPEVVDQWRDKLNVYLSVRPGILNPSSLVSCADFEQMIDIETRYIMNRTISTDVALILKTIKRVLLEAE